MNQNYDTQYFFNHINLKDLSISILGHTCSVVRRTKWSVFNGKIHLTDQPPDQMIRFQWENIISLVRRTTEQV